MSEAVLFEAPPSAPRDVEVEDELLHAMLRPYKPHCRYLQRASVSAEPLAAEGDFSIPDSCYIESTGHFNAVEFNICFNQLAYVLVGAAVKRKLVPQWRAYTYERFKERQLGDMLIVKLESSFEGLIDPRGFRGELRVERMRAVGDIFFVDTSIAFSNGGEVRAHGKVRLCCARPVSSWD